MKKVLLIFNGINSPENVLSFIKKNLKTEGVQFHGIFIRKLQRDQPYNYPFPNDLSATAVDYSIETEEAESYRLIHIYINLFEGECRANNMEFKTDFFIETPLEHLIANSGFVDLIISDRKTEFDDDSIDKLLVKAHCPVLLVGTAEVPLTQAVLTYDGSANSMHAIRQYKYLFPELASLQTHLLSVVDEDVRQNEKENTQLNDWLAQHFKNFTINIRYGHPELEMVDFINRSGNSIVVMGAFGRSSLSRWLQSSHAEKILSDTKATVFTTHLA